MSKQGFTLIELLVVISIISLLSSVVLSTLNSAREKGRIAAGKKSQAVINHALADMAVGMWELNEGAGTTLVDRSGVGGSGSFATAPSWSTDTPNGTGWSLSMAVGQGFTVADDIDLDPGLGSATRGFWFKTTQNNASLFRKSDTSNTLGMLMSLSVGRLECRVHDNGVLSMMSSNTFDDGKWHFGVCVLDRDKQMLSVYVDGVLHAEGSAAAVNGVNLNSTSLVYFPSPYWDSAYLIDSIHFYNKALTALDVSKIFALEAPRFKVALE